MASRVKTFIAAAALMAMALPVLAAEGAASSVVPGAAPTDGATGKAQRIIIQVKSVDAQGNALEEATLVTFDGQPVSMSNMVDHSYVSSFSREVDATGSMRTVSKMGILSTGMRVAVMPTMIDATHVNLSVDVDSSIVDSLVDFAPPAAKGAVKGSIQLPTVGSMGSASVLVAKVGEAVRVLLGNAEGRDKSHAAFVELTVLLLPLTAAD